MLFVLEREESKMKKLFVLFYMIIGVLSISYVVNAAMNKNINAASSPQYYGVGTTFTMGGYNWKIIKVNNNRGYIQTSKEVTSVCSHSSYLVTDVSGNLAQCIQDINKVYSTGMSDRIGQIVKGSNPSTVSSIGPVSETDYSGITDNGSNMSYFPDYTWINKEMNPNHYVFFHSLLMSPNWVSYNSIPGLYYDASNQAGNYLIPTYLIELPQKNVISRIQSNVVNVSMPYNDANNVTNHVLVNISTSDGEGPYHFTMSGTTSLSGNLSSYISLVPDPINGSAELKIIGNHLPVGEYDFKVKVVDESTNTHLYIDPNNFAVDTARMKETGTIHISVTKVNTGIVFDNPNMTKKSMHDANTSWSETATATPMNADLDIKYTIVGGDVGMINIDPDTGAITYNGGNAFGKVKIRATVDDDPSTGNDYYNSSFVEKEIVIYREVDGVITPDPASSDTTIPTFSANDTNIKTGGTIGKVQGTLGTPDTVGGSTTTYSYTIKPDPTSDGSLFQVNASTGVIKANANLGVDTYNFVIIVSDKWSSKEIPVTVNVGKAPAENLKFYQSPTSNTIITTKSATLTDTGVSVFATVKVTLRHSINSIINHSFYAK